MTDHSANMQGRIADMMEATRLTGSGRLEEATALIQRSLFDLNPYPAQPARDRTAEAPPVQHKAISTGDAQPNPSAATQAALVPERVREVIGSVARGLAPMLKGLGGGLGAGLRAPEPQEGGGGSFVARSFANAAGARDYKLFIPSRPKARAPLVVMLHGCTQSPDDFAAGTGMNALAERAGIFVAYPGQTGRAHAQKCWNWYEPRDQGRESGEAAIIAGLTRAVMEEHGIDPARVYVAGLSAGGAAAANLARAYPDLYAAVGIHSGLAAGCARDLGSALMAMQGGAPGSTAPNGFGAAPETLRVPTIVFHGEDDTTVSARNADQILAQAGADGLKPAEERFEGQGHPFTRTRYSDARGRVLVESWRVRGAGHAWSGGDTQGSYTDPQGPDASRAMLDFFAGHRLGAVRG
ncbi:extracellular catalytic domain type 1 short-chain-length polyhydroxyalkanoate depolymerase [Methylobacterium trifolii]|uniref:Esterase n=1 Tax=Methylobacterium trifolii TaxID=1003092 RepID=A0ABQ4TY04_9HYPH|nr:PHB depolymerase family esterase [Methylobacterium trifolii]GJE58927.1 hypothetical protein MPOCJGCO_1012 [Methylobacterium trifolii]